MINSEGKSTWILDTEGFIIVMLWDLKPHWWQGRRQREAKLARARVIYKKLTSN